MVGKGEKLPAFEIKNIKELKKIKLASDCSHE